MEWSSNGGASSDDMPWGPASPLYAPMYDDACPAGHVSTEGACVAVEAWLASLGFETVCTADARGQGDATTIAGCGYAEGQATVVRAGTYREDVRPTADRFALVAYPGERPVVSGADVLPPGRWVPVGDGLWRHAWEWSAQGTARGETSAGRRRELLVVAGEVMEAVGGEQRPTLEAGQFWVEGAPSAPRAVILNPPQATDPNELAVETGQRWQLFYPADASGGPCGRSRRTGLLVAGMTFRHGTARRQRFAVCLGGARGTILDSDIGWQNGGGLDLAGSGHRAVGNLIHDNGIEGVGGTRSIDVEVAFNEVRRNGWADPAARGHGGAGKFTRSRGLIVRHNVFADNDVNGLWLDIHNRNAIIAANLFARNANTGLFLELFSDSSLVAGNLCVANRVRPDDAPGRARLAGCLRLTDASANVVAFNTVVKASNAALVVLADDRSLWPCEHDGDPACGPDEARSGQNPYAPVSGSGPLRSWGNAFFNNLLLARPGAAYANARGQRVQLRGAAAWVAAGDAGTIWGGNLAWAPEAGTRAYRAPTAQAGVDGRSTFSTPLAVLADTSTVAGMLRLAAGSPARGAAVAVPASLYLRFDAGPRRNAAIYHLAHDAWGDARPVPANVGAGR